MTEPHPADHLRHQIARALVRYDWNAGLSGRVTPSAHHYGEADAVMAVLPTPADPATEVERLQGEILDLRAERAKLCDLLRAEGVRANSAIKREEIAEKAELEARADRATALRDAATSIREAKVERDQLIARIAELEGERERAIRWAVHLEGDQRRQKVMADEAHERARVATVVALNLQRRTPDTAQCTLDRIRQATNWNAVWVELGQYYGLSAEQAGAEARSRRIATTLGEE